MVIIIVDCGDSCWLEIHVDRGDSHCLWKFLLIVKVISASLRFFSTAFWIAIYSSAHLGDGQVGCWDVVLGGFVDFALGVWCHYKYCSASDTWAASSVRITSQVQTQRKCLRGLIIATRVWRWRRFPHVPWRWLCLLLLVGLPNLFSLCCAAVFGVRVVFFCTH